MKRLSFVLALAMMLAVGLAQDAKATLTFSAAQLDAFDLIDADPAYFVNDPPPELTFPAGFVTLSADGYSDGQSMFGVAGATGRWNAAVGVPLEAFFGSQFSETAAFSSETLLTIVAWNDNNSTWAHDVWIETLVGGVLTRVQSAPVDIAGFSSTSNQFDRGAVLNLTLTGNSAINMARVVGWGVSVHGIYLDDGTGDFPSAGDAFHTSWQATPANGLLPIPEPSMMIVFGSLIGICCGIGVRRRQRQG